MPVSSVRRLGALALILAPLVAPPALAAQNRFAITPWVGSYYALSKFYNDNLDLTTIGGTGTVPIIVGQENTAMYGIRATVPMGATLAMEGSFGYARSDVRYVIQGALTTTSGEPFDISKNQKGSVIIGSLRVVIKPRRSNLSVFFGGIVVNHGGKFWNDSLIDGKKTNFGGVFGMGMRANVTPRFPIDIRGEINMYKFNPDKNDNASLGFYPGKMQSDLIFSLGVPIGPR